MDWAGLGLYWPSHKAGLSPAAWAGLMFQPLVNRAGLNQAAWAGLKFQPEKKRGWADVTARRRRKETQLIY